MIVMHFLQVLLGIVTTMIDPRGVLISISINATNMLHGTIYPVPLPIISLTKQ
jgi:hypothetical protein